MNLRDLKPKKTEAARKRAMRRLIRKSVNRARRGRKQFVPDGMVMLPVKKP